MLGLKHVLKYCANAKYVMKTDSDVYVNVPAILTLLSESNFTLHKAFQIPQKLRRRFEDNVAEDSLNNPFKMYGLKNHMAKPVRNMSGPKAKWYVEENEYVGNYYPDYLDGHGYILSMQLVQDIVKVSERLPFFKFEDVYIGMCLQKLGYSVKHTNGFLRTGYPLTLCSHKYRNIFTVHRVDYTNMSAIWYEKCPHFGLIDYEFNEYNSERLIRLKPSIIKKPTNKDGGKSFKEDKQ
ncbi:Beta-1 [Mactra antiquata]